MSKLFWNPGTTPAEVCTLLQTLMAKGYPLAAGEGDLELRFHSVKGETVSVRRDNQSYSIAAGNLAGFARGIGAALAGTTGEETSRFDLLGIMIDCSRNKVFTIGYLEDYLAKLALLGYNNVMLYTEDTYCLPGEPFFGYLRGAYSLEELQHLDRFAAGLGIELVACIQTLGHLAEILQWPAFDKVRDTASVLMVDEPETYRLIEKMVAFWAQAFRSRRIHIGMDETHDLGRGRYLDRHGFERGFDLFNRHLGKVNEICAAAGYATPMIWSDMYFRLGNPVQDYYNTDNPIPQDVREKIPSNVRLVYWDYYHEDAKDYERMIKAHCDIGFKPVMGSGVWTWSKLWCDLGMTRRTVGPCVETCLKTDIRELFFTMWGDDGAYCLYGSSIAGLAWAADLAYGGNGCAARFQALTGRDFQLYSEVAKAEYLVEKNTHLKPLDLIWDDAMLAVELRGRGAETVREHYAIFAEALRVLEASGTAGSDLEAATMAAMLRVATLKIDFRNAVEGAYRAGDKATLKSLVAGDLVRLLARFDEFDGLMRRAWFSMAKPFGWEVIQVRNAGARARLVELGRRLEECGFDGVEELEAGFGDAPMHYSRWWYANYASSTVIK